MTVKLTLATILNRLDALERRTLGPKPLETRAERAKRKGVSSRTIARRVAAGTEAQPKLVDGRWYFEKDDESERGEADTAEARAARNPRLRSKGTPASPEV
jgi:hypothetical protein